MIYQKPLAAQGEGSVGRKCLEVDPHILRNTSMALSVMDNSGNVEIVSTKMAFPADGWTRLPESTLRPYLDSQAALSR